MINAPYAEQAFEHLYKFWRFENHNRPAIAITTKNPNYIYKEINTPEKIIDRWLDIDYVINANRDRLNRTLFYGDALPCVNLNLGPDVFAGLYGCELIHDECTSWAVHDTSRPLKDYDLSKVDEEGFWWKKTMEMTKALVEDSNGDYLVGVTDIHAGLDALVSLRGPEQVCLDLYDEPAEVKRLLMELFEGFKKYFNQICSIIETKQKGHTNWLGPWSDKRWYVTSCDFIYMISEEMFEEFELPLLKAELEFLGRSIFHLDGVGSLRHLDRILKLDNLNGIQWVPGAGKPTAPYWIDVYKKIQDAGKINYIYPSPEEVPMLLEHLRPEGVFYLVHCETPKEAEELFEFVSNYYIK